VSETEPLRAPQVFTRDPVPREPPRPRRRIWPWVLLAFLLLFLAPPAAVVALRWLPPPTSAFMLQSPVKPVDYVWVPAAHHPKALRDAVIAAEDQKFFTHHGFDFEAIEKALAHNQKSKRKRGASTITQQVAKNLFLWPSRSYLRKGLEVTFTVLLELGWPKDRILEVYLNIAEFGPGVYGVEAAARKFFDRSAQELSPAQSARLAAVLPNPRKWRADRPGPYVQARADWILAQIGYGPVELPEPEPTEPIPSEPQAVEPLDEASPSQEPGFEVAPPEEAPATEGGAPAPTDPSAPPEAQPPPAAEPGPDQAPEIPPVESDAPADDGAAEPAEAPPAPRPAY
jgi:monofunctional biosynthetic peptidoglycan transglycosylase